MNKENPTVSKKSQRDHYQNIGVYADNQHNPLKNKGNREVERMKWQQDIIGFYADFP